MLSPGFWGFLGTFTNMPITSSILIHYRANKYPIEYTHIPKVSDIYRRHSAATAPPGGGTIYIFRRAKHGFSNVGHEKMLLGKIMHPMMPKNSNIYLKLLCICFYSSLAAFYSSRYDQLYILLHTHIYVVLGQQVVMRSRIVTYCCRNT